MSIPIAKYPSAPVLSRVVRFILTGFFSGASGSAPGTRGTAVMMVLVFLLFPRELSIPSQVGVAALLLLIGVMLLGFGYRVGLYPAEDPDQGEIVIDEFVGYCVTLIGHIHSPLNLILAFFAFRLFDIWKPGPIRRVEKLPGAWGVMLDDVAAGVAANLLLFLIEGTFVI